MISLLFASAVISAQAPSAPPGQVAPQIEVEKCLHGKGETAAEKTRREEALATMRMVDWTLADGAKLYAPSDSSWPLTDGRKVSELRAMDGAVGELARKIEWDAQFPLPGWRLSLTRGRGLPSVFSLIDTTDPCGFRFDSSDETVIPNRPRVQKLG
jgi:hypothetical protein